MRPIRAIRQGLGAALRCGGYPACVSTGLANQYLDNDVSSAIYSGVTIKNDWQFVLSGNDFTDANTGLRLESMSGLTLDSTSLPDDLSTAGKPTFGPALYLWNVTNSTVDLMVV